MSIVFKDFGTAYLAAPLAVGGLTITVDNPTALPILTNSDYFYLVLQKYGDRSYVEIVKVTATAGSTYTIQRGQAGTSVRAFAVGDYAELRLTVDGLAEYITQNIAVKMDKSGGGDFSGLYRFLNPNTSRIDVVRTSDNVAASLVVDFSASEGHRTIIGGTTGSNVVTPSILLRPNGHGSGAGQVKIDSSGLVDVVGLNVRGPQGTDAGSVVRYDYLSNLVPAVRKVNGRELSADIALSYSDVKAAPEGFGLGTVGIQKTAQDQTQAGFWRDSAIPMAGITLPYDASPLQAFIGVNTSQKRLKFGYRNGATTVPIEWFDVYSDNNKPTAAALGVVPASQLLPLSGTVNWADLVGKVPVINSAGVTELGRYLDMREQDANVDFNWRLDAGIAGANKLSILNSGGGPVFEFTSTGRFKVPVNGGDIAGRLQVYNGVNPMYEWHIPGKYAAASHLTASNDWRFVQSDGIGGETAYRFVSFADGRFICKGAVLSDHNTGSAWSEFNTASFRVNNARTIAAGGYHKVISHRLYTADNYEFENSLGAFADAAGWDMLCHTLVSTSGPAGVTRIWKFRNDGNMSTPSGSAFDKEGNSWGSIFGGSSLTYWAINRFAPISDIRYKKNITECDGFALDVIEKFRFYAYDWDESKKIVADKHHVRFGVSAQEVELIDKAYVKESEVHEVMGEDPVTIKTLDDSNLLTLALKAIQELKARVEFLESRAV